MQNGEWLTLTQEDANRLIALCVIVENTYANENKLWNKLQLECYVKCQSGTRYQAGYMQLESDLLKHTKRSTGLLVYAIL